jgi:membrane protein DedA with SNARE-associated domain
METFISWICENAHDAYWIIFLMLMLAGLNVPISEDLMLLIGGMIASTCIPDQWLHLFIWVWIGCYFSAWEAYFIGRLLGPKLYNIKWFSHVITQHRIERINHYYEKFGILTFIVGRFCPGGVRNCLFMTAGLGKMPFLKFALRDGLACFISSNVLFHIGYKFGEHRTVLLHYFRNYEIILISIVVLIIVFICSIIWIKKNKGTTD